MRIRKFYLGELVQTHAPTLFVEFDDAGEVGWSPVNLETARQLAAQLNQAIARADRHLDWNESQRGFGASYGTTDGPLGAAERGN